MPSLSTNAIVLAAGLGTRLRPLTDVLPKPLVPIGERPAVAHVLDGLEAAGFSRAVVNAHHLRERFERFAEADSRVVLSIEERLLGTAGGVQRALERGLFPGDRVLAVNTDLFGALPLAELAGAAGVQVARLLVAPADGGGNVGVDADGAVVRLRRETFRPGERSAFDYLGCALLGPDALAAMPLEGCLVGDVLIPLLRAGAHVSVHAWDGPWLDVGSRASYLLANRRWLEIQGISSFVHPSARVVGAVIGEGVVVGADAAVAAGASLERCVVWPGAEVAAGCHADAIFVPELGPVPAS